MKLKDTFLRHDVDGSHVLVNTDGDANAFHGLVKSNDTAAFIISLLAENTTMEAMIQAMMEKYADTTITTELAKQAIEYVLAELKKINAIED